MSSNTTDECSICLNALAPGSPLLTLSCNHKFHLQCLASNLQAQNRECPLCRATVDASIVQLLTRPPPPPPPAIPSPLPPLPIYTAAAHVSHFCVEIHLNSIE